MGSVEGLVRRSIGRRGLPIVVVVVVVVAGAAAAPAATVVSETTWGGAGAEVTNGAAVASDAAAYLAGFTTSFDPFAQENVFVVGFAADGSLAWRRTWDGPEQFANDRANGVAVAADGSVYVAGQTLGVRGDVLMRQLGRAGLDHGDDVEVAQDGTVVLGATTESSPPFTLADCPRQTGKLRGSVAAPDVPLADVTGALADPGGTVAAPDGSSPGAGGFDAALVRLTP
jgi:hypothetical protein